MRKTFRLLLALAVVAASLLTFQPAAQAAPAWATVKSGQQGYPVLAVQWLLRHHNITVTVDGDFGDGTLKAVKAFQSSRGLGNDGAVGAATWPRLVVQVQDSSPVSDAVRAAQIMLNKYGYMLKPDGDFGQGTLDATKDFQRRVGIKDDGIIGATTWQFLSGTPTSSAGWANPIPQSALSGSKMWYELWASGHHDYPAIDIMLPSGTPQYAIHSGTASNIRNDGCGYGVNLAFNGINVAYCHYWKNYASGTRTVSAGTTVGLTGSTGVSDGPHIHIQMRTPDGVRRCIGPVLIAIKYGYDIKPQYFTRLDGYQGSGTYRACVGVNSF